MECWLNLQDRAKSEIYSVSQVNRYINYMFTQDFLLRFLTVRGEVSNCTDHPSGHLYFTLKDATGILSCVMFASKRSGLSFRMQSGMQVLVSGAVGVYQRGGKYQLLAEEIRQDGSGSIYERFEKLKKELEERGMFDPSYKQPIPKYIRKLGVVTAPGGAALRDIIQITLRRNPYIQIILYPALVQGEKAAQSIAEGIVCLSQTDVDVMIVGRGGGSIEELSA
ncbi:MAG: exodeoxyribonuclease VII large subunit, partial [Lachnospiraceae bacterium]|nr:exodeoxyribonuclease VII large subunit [Lachnospiraceae bacterium]